MPRTNRALEGKGGIPIKDLPDVLVKLYPALLTIAERELAKRGQPEGSAEDLVQGAVLRALEASDRDLIYAFMRIHIRNAAREVTRPGRDALSRNPLSLDSQIEEE